MENRRFPSECLPAAVKEVYDAYCRADGFNADYLGAALLSAACAAIGNNQKVRIRNNWEVAPLQYIALVGRPGAGKTPPLEKAYAPLRQLDKEEAARFRADKASYESQPPATQCASARPVLRLSMVNDSTPEATLYAHYLNPRGVTIFADELMGFFNSVNRYNNGQFIEQMLSAWSGSPIYVTRKTNQEFLSIDKPCFNLVGSIQTQRCIELFDDKYVKSGFIDRMLFCYPENVTMPKWGLVDTQMDTDKADAAWNRIIRNLRGFSSTQPRSFTYKAMSHFVQWWNEIVDAVNETEDDCAVDTRQIKRSIIVARLALVLQALSEADSGNFTAEISERSTRNAVIISDYFEQCVAAVQQLMEKQDDDSPANVFKKGERVLQALPHTFTTKEFQMLTLGEMSETSSRKCLSRLVAQGKLARLEKGTYQKTA